MADESEPPLHGDVLHSVLANVPLVHLLPSCHVSKSWKSAVSASLRHVNPVKPWLLLYTQATRSPYLTTAYAYDPRSQVWIHIQRPSIPYVSALRSSHSTLLYMLSPSTFSFSFDPLHLTWTHVKAPLVWRTDPIVAMVDHLVIVAGGACDFEDDPLAVEMYDMRTGAWDTCESMPAIFKDCAASTWLSLAVVPEGMLVMEKSSGVTYRFDPSTKAWQGPYKLRPDENACCSVIGFANGRLILIDLIGDEERVNQVKLWELDGESLEVWGEIGEMPEVLVEKLNGEACSVSSVTVTLKGDVVYMNNKTNPEEVFMCEVGGGVCGWSSVRNAVASEKFGLTERVVFTCSNVGLRDLHSAITSNGTKFVVRERV